MLTTTMEIQTKKEKPNKKRKTVEPLEATRKRSSTTRTSPTAPTPHTNINDNDEASEELPKKKRKTLVEQIEVDITRPEPPSKKALRRLKKGKSLPPPKSGADTTPEPDNEQPKKAEVVKWSDYGIWIGNLPWSATKADVLAFLTTSSSITSEIITRIHMPSPSDDGKPTITNDPKPWKKQQFNKGFAYIDFATPEAVSEAVSLSELLLSGRRVLIKDAKSFEGRPQKTKEESRNDAKPPSKRIFVGNLRFDTTEEGLKEHFECCGEVEHVMVATFEDSGKCKGYGWVTFKQMDAAEAAVRGWVLIEEEDGEEDSDEDDGNESDSMIEADRMMFNERTKLKGPKMKKTFVDKIHKRPVRREFAEDAQVRYKKRYGKDGTKAKNGVSAGAGSGAGVGDVDVETTEEAPAKAKERKMGKVEKVKPSKQVEYRTPHVARLIGSIVESKGKKVIF
jgi:RNA recognition motif. (a.k.a. RRM, RBD, or RNP domain)